jgi:hypothetical protein
VGPQAAMTSYDGHVPSPPKDEAGSRKRSPGIPFCEGVAAGGLAVPVSGNKKKRCCCELATGTDKRSPVSHGGKWGSCLL